MRQQIARRALTRGFAGLAVATVLVALTGCAPAGKPEVVPSDDSIKASVTVRVIDNQFIPSEVEIVPGQAVRWVFEGAMEHDVVADDGSFVSELVTEGHYTHAFMEVGEFAYDCSTHPEMTGVVKVVEP